jgi:hypothetical protein
MCRSLGFISLAGADRNEDLFAPLKKYQAMIPARERGADHERETLPGHVEQSLIDFLKGHNLSKDNVDAAV